MADTVTIPKITSEDDLGSNRAGAPGWAECHRLAGGTGIPLKPLIRCNCGEWSGIGLHHVHQDGRVTASFFHATAAELAAMGEGGKRFHPGCGWHVFLILADYDYGEYLPNQDERAPAPCPAPAPKPDVNAPSGLVSGSMFPPGRPF
jgi:hypothetical protein